MDGRATEKTLSALVACRIGLQEDSCETSFGSTWIAAAKGHVPNVDRQANEVLPRSCANVIRHYSDLASVKPAVAESHGVWVQSHFRCHLTL